MRIRRDGGLLGNVFAGSAGKVLWDVAARGLHFLLSLVVARSLGAEVFGRYAVLWYLAWMAAQVTDLGLHLVVLRNLSRAPSPSGLRAALCAKALLSAFSLSAVGLAVAAGAGPASTPLLLYGSALTASWIDLFGVVLRSRGRLDLEGMVTLLSRSGWLAGALLVVHRGGAIPELALALFVAGFPALFLSIALVIGTAGRGDDVLARASARALLRQSAPLALTAIITLLYLRLDLLLVAELRDNEAAGLFAAAFRLLEALFVFSGGILAGAFPWIASRAARDELETVSGFVLGLLLWVALPAATGFVILAGPIVAFLYGPEYAGAAAPLRWLGLAVVAVYVNALTTHLLVAARRGRALVGVMLLRLGVGLTVDLLLIPRYGAAGAAIAVAAAEASLTLASWSATRHLLKPLAVWRAGRMPALASLLMAGVVFVLPLGLPLRISLGAAAYLAVFCALWRWGFRPASLDGGTPGAGKEWIYS